MPRIATFVTLSPAPNFAEWLERERASQASLAIDAEDREALAALDGPIGGAIRRSPRRSVGEPLHARGRLVFPARAQRRGLPVDAVARFHLGNGARLERLDWLGDTSERAFAQSYGLMVNYLYELDSHRAEPRSLCATTNRGRSQRGEPAGARPRPQVVPVPVARVIAGLDPAIHFPCILHGSRVNAGCMSLSSGRTRGACQVMTEC